jgi:hypothetical protein
MSEENSNKHFTPCAISICMLGGMDLSKDENLFRFVDIIEKFPHFEAELWGIRELTEHEVNLKGDKWTLTVLKDYKSGLFFSRDKGDIKYFCHIKTNGKPYIKINFDKLLPQKDWALVFQFADAIAHFFQPDIATVHIWPEFNHPWLTEQDKVLDIMSDAAFLNLGEYYKSGPKALTMRTYFGSHYSEQFGATRLFSTPGAIIDVQEWGGIRLDLGEAPWDLSIDQLIKYWQSAMQHLKPAKVFSELEVTPHSALKYTLGADCIIADS